MLYARQPRPLFECETCRNTCGGAGPSLSVPIDADGIAAALAPVDAHSFVPFKARIVYGIPLVMRCISPNANRAQAHPLSPRVRSG